MRDKSRCSKRRNQNQKNGCTYELFLQRMDSQAKSRISNSGAASFAIRGHDFHVENFPAVSSNQRSHFYKKCIPTGLLGPITANYNIIYGAMNNSSSMHLQELHLHQLSGHLFCRKLSETLDLANT
ncbi:hypothetical protein TNCV_2538601 [Trichonephila clavipes]|nr:hypothetical protein TNCV_2538601 [Trichonephila clavipes]